MTTDRQKALQKGRERALKRRRREALRRVKAFRAWLRDDAEFSKKLREFESGLRSRHPGKRPLMDDDARAVNDNDYKIAREEGLA